MFAKKTVACRSALLCASVIFIAATSAQAAERQKVRVQISSQDLASALNEFARQSKQQILFAPQLVQGKRARAVSGTYPPNAVLAQMLRGTGLVYKETPSGAFLLAASNASSQPAVKPQTPPAPAPAQMAPDDDEPDQLADDRQDRAEDSTIVVTGTRIQRPDFQFPYPVTSFSHSEIVSSGRTNLTDFLAQNPELANSANNGTFAGGLGAATPGMVGVNLLNLRSLGTERTLVLVDGRRHVAAFPTSAAVDINTIPIDLIERIDVLTGGASAVYGADGVSGVINFILKKDFQGIAARGQIGISDEGDAGNRFAAITAGTNFAGNRGNIAVSYEFSHDDRLLANRRPYLVGERRLSFLGQNPSDIGDNPNVPDYTPLALRYFDSSRAGAVDVNFDFVPDFQGDGTPFKLGTFVAPFYAVSGSGTLDADYLGSLLPEIERHSLNGLLRFEITDGISLFAQGKYVSTDTLIYTQPFFNFMGSLFFTADNPFMPQAIRSRLVPGLAARVFGPGTPDGALMGRDHFDLGLRGENTKRETIRGVAGVEGDVSDNLRLELSYVYGHTKVDARRLNIHYRDRLYAAADAVVNPATGQIVCRSSLNLSAAPLSPGFPGFLSFQPGPNSGCVPLNLFGEGGQSQAAIDWLRVDPLRRLSVEQHVVSGSLSGDTARFLDLPGGPVGFAVGAEWRREASQLLPAPEEAAGLTGRPSYPTRGSFDVKEAFGELNIPLLKDRPLAHQLSVGAALRLSDYSTVGSTMSWKVDAFYAPVQDISFRGTYAQAVRAPNIGELFSPLNIALAFFADPCDIANQNNGSSNRAANCTTLLTAAGANPATFVDSNSGTVIGSSSGNPDLKEETARTKTAGIVLRPRFLPGFTAAVDWYDIKLKNAINTASAGEIAALCVDQPSVDNIFCDAIQRQSGGVQAGRITSFVSRPENVASFRTSGVDLNVSYQWKLSARGLLKLDMTAGYLDRLEFISTPMADITNSRNVRASPKWVVNFDASYKSGPFTLTYGLNYIGRTLRFDRATTTGDPDYVEKKYFHIKERWMHDMQVSVDASERFNFYAGVNNIADQRPDIGEISLPVSPVGRAFYVGARLRFIAH